MMKGHVGKRPRREQGPGQSAPEHHSLWNREQGTAGFLPGIGSILGSVGGIEFWTTMLTLPICPVPLGAWKNSIAQ